MIVYQHFSLKRTEIHHKTQFQPPDPWKSCPKQSNSIKYSLKPNSGTPINAGFSPKLQNPTNSIHSVWLVAERTRCNRIKCFWPGPRVREASASVESSTPKHGEWKIIAHQKQTIDARFGVVALLRPFFCAVGCDGIDAFWCHQIVTFWKRELTLVDVTRLGINFSISVCFF